MSANPRDQPSGVWATRVRCVRCGWSTPATKAGPFDDPHCTCGGELERYQVDALASTSSGAAGDGR